MPYRNSLTLKAAGKPEFAVIVASLCFLALIAALLSPRPLLMSMVSIIVCVAGWGAYILRNSNVESGSSNLTIFADGQIRLESCCSDAGGGALTGQQWSTRFFASLRVVMGGEVRYFLVLAFQQHADEYRRLLMWLRQGLAKP